MILIECNPDEELVKSLGVSRKLILHKDKYRIIKELRKSWSNIAIIDEDPDSPMDEDYTSSLTFLEEKKHLRIKVFIDQQRQHKVIILCPRIEGWAISNFNKLGIDMSNYGLPNNDKELKKVINYRLRQWSKLLDSNQNCEHLIYLKNHIFN